MGRFYLYRLYGFTVLREHRYEAADNVSARRVVSRTFERVHVVNDLDFGCIYGSYLNKDISSLESYLRVIAIDDRWK